MYIFIYQRPVQTMFYILQQCLLIPGTVIDCESFMEIILILEINNTCCTIVESNINKALIHIECNQN
jgi:hypothetical protein